MLVRERKLEAIREILLSIHIWVYIARIEKTRRKYTKMATVDVCGW